MFESRDQRLKLGVTSCAGLPEQFDDEKAMHEVVILTDTEELETEQYDSTY